MNDNIMDILDETINKNIEINKSALEKLIYATCDYRNLKDYVKYIYIPYSSRTPIKAPMAYDMLRQIVIVNLEETSKFLREMKTLISMNDGIKEEYKDIWLKLFLEQIVLHEMEHVHQNKMIKEKETDIEARLVGINAHMTTITYQSNIEKSNMLLGGLLEKNSRLENCLHDKYGSSMPMEKLAEYHSLKEMISYLSSTTTDYSDITSLLNGYLINVLLDGYDFTSFPFSPTKRYIYDFKQANFIKGKKHFTKEFYHLLSEAEEDSLERRLSLGLDITKEEYTKVKKIIS